MMCKYKDIIAACKGNALIFTAAICKKRKTRVRLHPRFSIEPNVGLEPMTYALRMRCSTN